MLAVLGGCPDRGPPAKQPDAASTGHGTPFKQTAAFGAPLKRVLLIAKSSAKAGEAEAFYKEQILPILAKDRRVGNVTAFMTKGASGQTFALQIELRTWDEPEASLGLDILGGGNGSAAAETLRTQAAKLFDASSANVLYFNPELSISRDHGFKAGGLKHD